MISRRTERRPLRMTEPRIDVCSKSSWLGLMDWEVGIFPINRSAISLALYLSLLKTSNSIMKGVHPLSSKTERLAPYWRSRFTTRTISLFTAKWSVDPLNPLPLLRSIDFLSRKSNAISSFSLKIAKLIGVLLSLSSKFKLMPLLYSKALTTPGICMFTALCKIVLFQSSYSLMI